MRRRVAGAVTIGLAHGSFAEPDALERRPIRACLKAR